MHPPSRTFLIAALALLTGCAFLRQIVGKDSVDLEKADIRSMGVDIRKAEKTICPRERVQLAIFAEAVLDGDKEPKKLETWEGAGAVNKNGKLDFADFAFQSKDGAFDAAGWFSPNPQILATVSRELEIKAVYKRRPDKFNFTTTYKPDYDCIKASGRDGPAGAAGARGSAGASGTPGASGSYTTEYHPPTTPGGMSTTTSRQGPGGQGGNGSPGGPGGRGGDGGPGPRFNVYVTLVKTAFYDRLVAVKVSGDLEDFLLYPAEVALELRANGGAGGAGGAGGTGGAGGAGGSGSPPGASGMKGADGSPGAGGAGGPGGVVDIVYDARFEADLRAALAPQAHGGAGGGGATINKGAEGRVTWKAGDVKRKFADLGLAGVTPL